LNGQLSRSLCALATCAALCAAQGADFELDLDELIELSPRPGSVVDADLARFIAGNFAALTVGEPLSFDPHPAFIAATQRTRGQARLGATPGLLDGFEQGRPFAGALDPADPDAGRKAIWNMRYAYTGDSGLIPELHWQLRDWSKQSIDLEMLFAARSMRFMYRHVQQPLPFIDDNPQDAYGAFFMRAVEAGSYDGTEALVFVNRDEAREVNGWVYIPQLGRTQSLASFSTEESMFGSDLLPTDFLVYSSRVTDMDWRYLGTTYLLTPFYRHDLIEPAARKARKYDYWHTDFEGHAGCFPKVQWQLRPTLVVEGTARDSQATVQKRVLYLDQQTYVASLWKVYRAGEKLWKYVIAAYAHPNSHLRENNESGAPIMTAFSTIDIETNRCTTVQVLAIINVGEVEPADFSTANMEHGGGNFRRR